MKPATKDSPGFNDITEGIISWLRNELDDDSVCADDNFLEIGGHSMMAMELSTWLADRYGAHLDIRQLFEESLGKAVAGAALSNVDQ